MAPAKRSAANVARIAIWVLGGAVLLTLVAVAATAVTLPGCASCHARRAESVAQGAHGKLECTQCHVSGGVATRVAFAAEEVFGMALRVVPSGPAEAGSVNESACLGCHQDVMSRKVSANGVTIDHARCAKDAHCVDCHSTAGHTTESGWVHTYTMDGCLGCHGRGAGTAKCDACHSSRTPRERIANGAWAVTHGPDWRKTHGMGDLKTCSSCHPGGFCNKCHGISLPHDPDFLAKHPAFALVGRPLCRTCHEDRFCKDCHGVDMPHPAGFTPQHSRLAEEVGSAACARCHAKSDCDGCHVKHVHPGGAKLPAGWSR